MSERLVPTPTTGDKFRDMSDKDALARARTLELTITGLLNQNPSFSTDDLVDQLSTLMNEPISRKAVEHVTRRITQRKNYSKHKTRVRRAA